MSILCLPPEVVAQVGLHLGGVADRRAAALAHRCFAPVHSLVEAYACEVGGEGQWAAGSFAAKVRALLSLQPRLSRLCISLACQVAEAEAESEDATVPEGRRLAIELSMPCCAPVTRARDDAFLRLLLRPFVRLCRSSAGRATLTVAHAMLYSPAAVHELLSHAALPVGSLTISTKHDISVGWSARAALAPLAGRVHDKLPRCVHVDVDYVTGDMLRGERDDGAVEAALMRVDRVVVEERNALFSAASAAAGWEAAARVSTELVCGSKQVKTSVTDAIAVGSAAPTSRLRQLVFSCADCLLMLRSSDLMASLRGLPARVEIALSEQSLRDPVAGALLIRLAQLGRRVAIVLPPDEWTDAARLIAYAGLTLDRARRLDADLYRGISVMAIGRQSDVVEWPSTADALAALPEDERIAWL